MHMPEIIIIHIATVYWYFCYIPVLDAEMDIAWNKDLSA